MRLVDLEPKLYRYAGDKSFAKVPALADADSVMFLCPACFRKNGGAVGTHGIRIDFAGKAVPDNVCIHNSEGKPVRRAVSGTGVDDLTLSPSILLLGGCGWHGFVTSGGIVDA